MEVKEELLYKYPFYQPIKGYRYSIDALLLSGFIKDIKPLNKVLEIGTGSGIVTLLLSRNFPEADFYAIEIQEELYRIAKKNFKINDIDINMSLGDFKDLEGQDIYDFIVSNPPFFKDGLVPSNSMEAIARHELKINIKDLVEKSKKLLKTGGFLYLVYPANRLGELLYLMEEKGIRPYVLKPIYSKVDKVGELILIAGKKGYKGSLKMLSPLYIYEGKDYSIEIEDLFDKGVLKW